MIKPIIIDGVDVSECNYVDIEERKNYTDLIVCVACKEDITDYKECENNSNCYYKQLQRLKEENEELKEKVNSYNCSINCYKYRKSEQYKQALKEIRTACQYYIADERDLTPEQVIVIINEVLKDEIK